MSTKSNGIPSFENCLYYYTSIFYSFHILYNMKIVWIKGNKFKLVWKDFSFTVRIRLLYYCNLVYGLQTIFRDNTKVLLCLLGSLHLFLPGGGWQGSHLSLERWVILTVGGTDIMVDAASSNLYNGPFRWRNEYAEIAPQSAPYGNGMEGEWRQGADVGITA